MYISEVYGKGGISAKVVADSISDINNIRLLTLELNYPRFIHSEFMTHRMFSRNASSSRAIPIERVIQNVLDNPAMPIHWGKNKAGMQADEEFDDYWKEVFERDVWPDAMEYAVKYSKRLAKSGVHKQIANRITEPFQFIRVIVSATEWDNFFNQRLHPAAQPEIQELARCMKEAISLSSSTELETDGWHTPYVRANEWKDESNTLNDIIKISVARCARVSYLNHDNSEPDISRDIKLYELLLREGHMSPFEHVASPINPIDMNGLLHGVHPSKWEVGITHVTRNDIPWSGNFRGWKQWRHIMMA